MSNEVLRDHLEQLERTFRDSGETTLADLIQRIRGLPDLVDFLRRGLTPRNRRKRKKNDVSFQEREAWFKSYTYKEGSTLPEEEVQELVSLTCDWELEESQVQALQDIASLWISCPYIFWGLGNCENTILRAFNDLRNDHIRRKVLLATLSEYVEEQQKSIPHDSWQTYKGKSDSECEARPSFCLRKSLGHITRLLWPHADDDAKEKNRTWLALYSLKGWKWRQLEHPGFILSISDTPHTSYETGTWTTLQRSALNSWVKTTRQYRIIRVLDKAWRSITNRYRDGFATDNRQDVGVTQSGQWHTLNQFHYGVQREVADNSAVPLTLPPLRQTQQTNTHVLPPVPLPVPATSPIPHREPNPFQLSNQTRSLHPLKFSSLLSANPAATGNADIESTIQHNDSVQYSDSMPNLMGYGGVVPPQSGRFDQRDSVTQKRPCVSTSATSRSLRISSRNATYDAHGPRISDGRVTDTDDSGSERSFEESEPSSTTVGTHGEESTGQAAYDEVAVSNLSSEAMEILASIAAETVAAEFTSLDEMAAQYGVLSSSNNYIEPAFPTSLDEMAAQYGVLSSSNNYIEPAFPTSLDDMAAQYGVLLSSTQDSTPAISTSSPNEGLREEQYASTRMYRFDSHNVVPVDNDAVM